MALLTLRTAWDALRRENRIVTGSYLPDLESEWATYHPVPAARRRANAAKAAPDIPGEESESHTR